MQRDACMSVGNMAPLMPSLDTFRGCMGGTEGATTAARTARFRACTAWDGHFRFTTGFMEQPPIVTYPVLWETQRQYELLEAEYGVSTNVSATLGVAARWFADT